ncbi:hypothetical protein ACIQ57_02415 [Lysinibacillus xylanilyticus]|uniref:hypothetical protein n=1 Tax=Lysinibacillus xylanilyticus TaxID=582475 RepID=UPI0038106449
MIGVETGRLLGDQRLIGRPQEALLCAKAKRQRQCFICAKAKRQRQCFICAKAKRQRQSAQSERKSTTRYDDEPYLVCFYRQPIDRLNKKKVA